MVGAILRRIPSMQRQLKISNVQGLTFLLELQAHTIQLTAQFHSLADTRCPGNDSWSGFICPSVMQNSNWRSNYTL